MAYRFPSDHGAFRRFQKVPSRSIPAVKTRPRSQPPRKQSSAPPEPRPSYAEIDVVEADMSNDPRREES